MEHRIKHRIQSWLDKDLQNLIIKRKIDVKLKEQLRREQIKGIQIQFFHKVPFQTPGMTEHWSDTYKTIKLLVYVYGLMKIRSSVLDF